MIRAFRARSSALATAIVLLFLTVGAVVGGSAAGASAPPFADPNAMGTLTFCNQAQQPVTSGSLLSAPFVWTAVSSTAAPQGYSRAYLAAYQPIQFVDPGNWSGSQLTEPAVFSNPQHPMAQSIGSDSPLLWFVQKAPPHWDGLVQIRMFFTAPRQAVNTSPYPAAIIKISGNSWTLVSGGTDDCKVGRAVSTWGGEGGSNTPRTITVTGEASQTVPATGGDHKATSATTTSKSAAGAANGSGGSTSDSSTIAPTPTTTHGQGAAAISAAGGGSSGSGSSGLWMGLAVALVVIAAGAGAVIWRRRTRHAGASPTAIGPLPGAGE